MSKAQFLAETIKSGETYAGLILGKDGQPDYHLVLLPEKSSRLNWKAAMTWATSVGGDLPSRCEQSLLFANCKEEFDPYYYWSNESLPYSPDYAWMQNFDYGNQHGGRKIAEYRSRAVRRELIIQ